MICWLRTENSANDKEKNLGKSIYDKIQEILSSFEELEKLKSILPWIKSPNLASQILGGITKQLPIDWEVRYNYRPALLETFVQLDRFKGTCYRAANWIQIGKTKGYSLYCTYKKNVSGKAIFVYPLSKNFRQILCQ